MIADPLTSRLVIFAKAPVPGRVKTRLARRLGSRTAARVYKCLLRETVAALAVDPPAAVELWVTPHRHPFLGALARRYGARVRVQPTGDLGRRMHAALAGRARTVVVGGDCASLRRVDVARAFQALRAGADLVLAPAEDGGYTLVGGRCAPAAVFRGVPWSTSRVMPETLKRVRRLGLTCAHLRETWDVDDYRDWRRWRRARASDAVGTIWSR